MCEHISKEMPSIGSLFYILSWRIPAIKLHLGIGHQVVLRHHADDGLKPAE